MGRLIHVLTGKKTDVRDGRLVRDVKAGLPAHATTILAAAQAFLSRLVQRMGSRLTLAWCHVPAALMRAPIASGPRAERPVVRERGRLNLPGYRLRSSRA